MLSGRDLPGGRPHGHAFYLPEANASGRIDHVVVHAPDGLCSDALDTLDRIDRIWHDGAEWNVLLENFGMWRDFANVAYFQEGAVWQSVTPYLHPWYRKKSFGPDEQIRRESGYRGHPELELERLDTVSIRGRERRPAHFRRFRTKRGLPQPDTHGSFWRLVFAEPIRGPLALGLGCHFGLGCFRPAESVSSGNPTRVDISEEGDR